MAEEKSADSEKEEGEEKDSEKESEEEKEEEKEEEEEETKDDSEDYNPPVRKTVADFVAERRGKKIKKLQEKEEDGDDDEGIPEKEQLAGMVQQAVSQILDPILSSIGDTTDEVEITNFLSRPENAHFRKYEKKARKDAKVYKNIPIEKIFRSLAYDDKKSEPEAKSKPGVRGASRRETTANVPDFSKMSMKEIDEFNNKIREGKRVELT